MAPGSGHPLPNPDSALPWEYNLCPSFIHSIYIHPANTVLEISVTDGEPVVEELRF